MRFLIGIFETFFLLFLCLTHYYSPHFENSSYFRLSIRYMGGPVRLLPITRRTQRTNNIAKCQQATIYVNRFFESIAHVTGAMHPLRAGQIDKMKLGTQITRRGDILPVYVINSTLAQRFSTTIRPTLFDAHGENRMRTTRLLVH